MITTYKSGWICPKCNAACAPWLPQCFCKTVTTSIANNPTTTKTHLQMRNKEKCFKCGAMIDTTSTFYCHVC